MKNYLYKFHLLTSSKDKSKICKIDDTITALNLKNYKSVKTISKMNFNIHINNICEKAGKKNFALPRITLFINLMRRLLINEFFMSQFRYCPLVWMCHRII